MEKNRLIKEATKLFLLLFFWFQFCHSFFFSLIVVDKCIKCNRMQKCKTLDKALYLRKAILTMSKFTEIHKVWEQPSV